MPRLRLTMFFFSENQHALADRFPYVSIFVILFSACQLKIRLLNYVIHNLISCGWIEAGAGRDFSHGKRCLFQTQCRMSSSRWNLTLGWFLQADMSFTCPSKASHFRNHHRNYVMFSVCFQQLFISPGMKSFPLLFIAAWVTL